MWRPDNWDDKRKETVAEMGMLPNQVTFPILIPDSFNWALLKAQLYEAGADAILQAQMEQGVQIRVEGPGAEGNNPTRVIDSEGYSEMFWSHWSAKLGLTQGSKGVLIFIKEG